MPKTICNDIVRKYHKLFNIHSSMLYNIWTVHSHSPDWLVSNSRQQHWIIKRKSFRILKYLVAFARRITFSNETHSVWCLFVLPNENGDNFHNEGFPPNNSKIRWNPSLVLFISNISHLKFSSSYSAMAKVSIQ